MLTGPPPKFYGTRDILKRRQSRQFYISKVKSVFISGVKSTDAGECWAATRWGRLVSAHRGDLAAPKTPARVLFWSQRRHCPGGSRPLAGDSSPVGCDR